MKTFAQLSALSLLLLGLGLAACLPEEDPPAECVWDGATYATGSSWSAGDACNTCTCDADGAVACTADACLEPCDDGSQPLCVEYGQIACEHHACFACDQANPCDDGSWCRPTEEQGTECAAFAGPGDSCEGFVLPWWRNKCEPGLTCVPREATGDIPGTCAACNYNGTPYQAGESFPADDGCNTCVCDESGQVACTEMYCGASCHYLGEDYAQGTSFPSWDGCNTCGCSSEGQVACTKLGCVGCPDDQPLVNCFADPCGVSSCGVEGAYCVSSYCGGCHAYWFDLDGNSVCE